MKKRFLSVLLVAGLAVGLMAGCGNDSENKNQASAGTEKKAEQASGDAVKLVLSHTGATGSLVEECYNIFAEAAEEKSGGNVIVENHGSGTLVSSQETFEALQSGNIDMADFQISYFTSYVPELQAMEVPGAYKGGNYEALIENCADDIDAILQKYGIKYIAAFPQDTMCFIGQESVEDPNADLKGKSIRVSGEWNGKAVSEWGGSPVSIGITDVSTALERKTVDMVLSTWIACDGFKFYEQAPYITMTEIQEMFCGLAMNLDKWNSLTAEQQAAIEEAGKVYQTEGKVAADTRKQEFLDRMEDEDVTITYASDEVNQYFQDSAWEIINNEIKPNADELTSALIEAISAEELQ